MAFTDTPYIGGSIEARSLLKGVLNGARNPGRSRATRWVADDDSQGTNPGGQGIYNHPYIAYFLWQRYGNIPESQIIGLIAVGGGSPPAGIGIRSGFVGPVAAGDTPLARFPYVMEAIADSRWDNSVAAYGALWLLQADMLTISTSLTDIPRNVEYIKRSGLTFHMLIPHLATQGPTGYWRNSFSITGAGAYGLPNGLADTASGTWDLTSAQVADNDWLEVSAAYNFGSDPPTAANLSTLYPQVIVRSNTAAQVEVGPAWFASGDKSGISLISCSAGGKTTASHFTERPDWQLLGIAIDPEIYSLQCGCNDAAAGHSKATYKTNVSDKIDQVQHELPDAVILLIPDCPISTLTAPQLTEYNTFADALYEIAQADTTGRVVFINVQRRLQEVYGWNSTNAQTGGFTSDGVHYAVAGAKMVAQETVSGMFRAAGLENPEGGRARGGRGPAGTGSRLSRAR